MNYEILTANLFIRRKSHRALLNLYVVLLQFILKFVGGCRPAVIEYQSYGSQEIEIAK